MQIVILAGGLGTRLRPITENIPKPMVEIDGKPYLEYQIQMLKKHGFRKILLLVGYLSNQIEEYFGNGEQFDVSITYNHEKEPIGTGGALKLAEEKLDDEFILIYGDSYLDYDYHELIDFAHQGNYDLCLTAYNNSNDTFVVNNLEVQDGKVLQYKKGVQDRALNYVESGVLFVKKKILRDMEVGKIISLEEGVFPGLIKTGVLGAYPIRTRFYDIGTFERLKIFRETVIL